MNVLRISTVSCSSHSHILKLDSTSNEVCITNWLLKQPKVNYYLLVTFLQPLTTSEKLVSPLKCPYFAGRWPEIVPLFLRLWKNEENSFRQICFIKPLFNLVRVLQVCQSMVMSTETMIFKIREDSRLLDCFVNVGNFKILTTLHYFDIVLKKDICSSSSCIWLWRE